MNSQGFSNFSSKNSNKTLADLKKEEENAQMDPVAIKVFKFIILICRFEIGQMVKMEIYGVYWDLYMKFYGTNCKKDGKNHQWQIY